MKIALREKDLPRHRANVSFNLNNVIDIPAISSEVTNDPQYALSTHNPSSPSVRKKEYQT